MTSRFQDLDRFHSVDESEDVERYIRFLDLVSAMQWVRGFRARVVERLAMRPDGVVLDVGCGVGEVAAELSEAGVRAVGVDASAAMVEEARRRHPRVEFVQASASELPFEDASVDAYRAERLYQHLADPGAAAAEAYRILLPGGRIVVCERDWETLLFASDDRAKTRALANVFCDSLANGWIGRALPGVLTSAGFVDVAVSPEVLVSTELGPVEESMVATVAGDDAAWAAEQRRRAAEGTFLTSMTVFVVSAKKGDR